MTENEDWMEGIDESSLDRAVKAGEILPQLPLPSIPQGKTTSPETLYVKFLTNPVKKQVDSSKVKGGILWVADVQHQGARKQLITPKSLRFSLAKECRLHKLKEPKDNYFVIGAHMTETKYRKDSKLYWVQHKAKSGEEEAEQYEAEARQQTLQPAERQDPEQPSTQPQQPAKQSQQQKIDDFSQKFRVFTIDDFTQFMQLKSSEAQSLIQQLSNEGRIYEQTPGKYSFIN